MAKLYFYYASMNAGKSTSCCARRMWRGIFRKIDAGCDFHNHCPMIGPAQFRPTSQPL